MFTKSVTRVHIFNSVCSQNQSRAFRELKARGHILDLCTVPERNKICSKQLFAGRSTNQKEIFFKLINNKYNVLALQFKQFIIPAGAE